jgi:hypothetical protein
MENKDYSVSSTDMNKGIVSMVRVSVVLGSSP